MTVDEKMIQDALHAGRALVEQINAAEPEEGIVPVVRKASRRELAVGQLYAAATSDFAAAIMLAYEEGRRDGIEAGREAAAYEPPATDDDRFAV